MLWTDGRCSWTGLSQDVCLSLRGYYIIKSTKGGGLCIGGGPAGLTAAYLLSRQGCPVTVPEADPRYLGGLAWTVARRGYLCDTGPHRFFSKSAEVNRLWHEILGEDFIRCPRKTRIYYRGKFFDYPLRVGNVLHQLGFVEATACVLSYLKSTTFPIANPSNFKEWVNNHFGQRLYSIFFKSYTEKVWGMPCSEISADWAAQRIKDLSLWSAVKRALFPGSGDREVVKTLSDASYYPCKGARMMWERTGNPTVEKSRWASASCTCATSTVAAGKSSRIRAED